MKTEVKFNTPYNITFDFDTVLRKKGIYLSTSGHVILTLGNGHSYFYENGDWYSPNTYMNGIWSYCQFKLLDGSVTFSN